MECYLALKKNEITEFSGKLMNLECIILNEVTISQKKKFSLM